MASYVCTILVRPYCHTAHPECVMASHVAFRRCMRGMSQAAGFNFGCGGVLGAGL